MEFLEFLIFTKLKAYGISGRLFDWIISFLMNHKQGILVSGATSSWTEVLSGIPQGSMLGPLLFLIINLPTIFQNSCLLFANDLNYFSAVRNDDDARVPQNNLNNLIFWTNSWQLQYH